MEPAARVQAPGEATSGACAADARRELSGVLSLLRVPSRRGAAFPRAFLWSGRSGVVDGSGTMGTMRR